MTPNEGMSTIKIPERTDADPDGIDMDYEFDPDDYDDTAIHGFYMHRARRDALGLTWLEYVNAQSIPEHVAEMLAAHSGRKDDLDMSWLEYLDKEVFGAHVDAEAVAEAINANAGDGVDVDELVARVVDDLSADVRQAAYTGAKEAISEIRA